ncbi:hypothetical protein M5K25_014369 [Dendrobium thyrsiflorum]|uniref:ABC transmembrane type-1 domain-containing protein n=1 Tax=Dendrobium thyrsiflorum TaxID=117978 RepID=A0ABD0V2P9_DENTH
MESLLQFPLFIPEISFLLIIVSSYMVTLATIFVLPLLLVLIIIMLPIYVLKISALASLRWRSSAAVGEEIDRLIARKGWSSEFEEEEGGS